MKRLVITLVEVVWLSNTQKKQLIIILSNSEAFFRDNLENPEEIFSGQL